MNRSDDQWSFGLGLPHSESNGFLNPSFGYSGMYNWNRYSQQLKESQYWFDDLWSESCCGREDHVKGTITVSNKESSKPRELPHSRSNAEISAAFKYFKEMEW